MSKMTAKPQRCFSDVDTCIIFVRSFLCLPAMPQTILISQILLNLMASFLQTHDSCKVSEVLEQAQTIQM